MRQKSDLYNYQRRAVDHILGNNGSMLWLDVGMATRYLKH